MIQEFNKETFESREFEAYTDRLDVDILESIAEYKFVRNPKTGDTVYQHITYTFEKSTAQLLQTNITFEEVLEEIKDLQPYDSWFDYIGEDKIDVMKNLTNDRLAPYIHALFQYYGLFF